MKILIKRTKEKQDSLLEGKAANGKKKERKENTPSKRGVIAYSL